MAKRLDDIGNDLSKGVKSAKKGLDAFNSVLDLGKQTALAAALAMMPL